VVTLLISLAGPRLFGSIAPASPIGFAAAALLAYLAYAGIGVLIGVAAGNATVPILVGQLIYIPSIILGGLMVPASILPPALARLSKLLPASHAMRGNTAGSHGPRCSRLCRTQWLRWSETPGIMTSRTCRQSHATSSTVPKAMGSAAAVRQEKP
jgi:hypothetical protein